jgi:hypothetical protein
MEPRNRSFSPAQVRRMYSPEEMEKMYGPDWRKVVERNGERWEDTVEQCPCRPGRKIPSF